MLMPRHVTGLAPCRCPNRGWSVPTVPVPRRLAGVIVLALLGVLSAQAQRHPDSIGVGFAVGRPSGLTAKLYRPNLVAYDALLTTDLEELVRGAVYRVWERPLPDSPLFVYVGPGLIAGLEELNRTPLVRLGVGGKAGLNFYAERFEVFLHVTPRIRFLPTLDGDLGGGVGLRYYF